MFIKRNIHHLLLTRSLENILTRINLEVYGLGGISWFAVCLEAPEHNGALRFNHGAIPLPSTRPGEYYQILSVKVTTAAAYKVMIEGIRILKTY